MRVSKFLNYFWLLLIGFVTVAILWYCENSSSWRQDSPSRHLSVIARNDLKHPKKNLERTPSWDFLPRFTSESEMPTLSVASGQLSDFPNAIVLETAELYDPACNETTRIKILQTDFKYPFVRSEEVIDENTGQVVDHEEMIADHLLVSLPQGEDPTTFFNNLPPEVTSIIPITHGRPSYILQLASPSIASLPQLLDTLAADQKIIVEPDIVHHIPALASNLWMGTRWALNKIAGELSLFTAPSKQNSSIETVAIIDTGICDTHQELRLNMWQNKSPQQGDIHGWNAVDNNGDTRDDNGHGTFCAGIVGATGNNNMGVVGVAPKVRLMACKAFNKEGLGVVSDEVKCIDYARENGAQVLNCSWGGAPSQFLHDALSRAQKANIICVAAAGNDGADHENFYPAAYGADANEEQKLDNVISVAASTPEDTLAPFSHYGNVALAAPGVDICSTFNHGDDSYAIGSGTSMAAPYVTGAVALLKTQFPPDHPYGAIVQKIFNTADKVSGLMGKVLFGRLNVTKALTQ